MKQNKLHENNAQETLKGLAQQISRAIWLDDTAQTIACLAKLANCALNSGHVRGKELIDRPDVGSIDHALKALFNTVEQCESGKTECFSDLYNLCNQITSTLLNTNKPSSVAKDCKRNRIYNTELTSNNILERS